ncbi:collagen alpha-1(I) chain [Streptomyces sp. M1013]|uniref:PP2C family protein-serine/threonine phosphatase n=1 Tax=Streptomyces sp. M1013 TaxID=549798 RepID=UPI000978FB26|nr:PP2C family protein-serine/threonine phosphatase [Streptomyces sp. M1013]OMI91474.1 collagen alpha-1(I) chain [Streptomyces sp. M1013]
MDDLPSGPDARARLELTAIRELLKSQRRRIHSYARAHRSPSQGPVRPTVLPTAAFPSGREVLDALPVPALLLTPVSGDDGDIVDVHCTSHNAAAVAYAAERFPDSPVPEWSGPVSLYERFPSLHRTPLPGMISRAHRDHEVQGPTAVEWVANATSGPVRLIADVRVGPCGDQLLLTWERGHRLLMSAAAQRLVRTCWAEWNLGDDGVEPSRGFRQALGLPENEPLPTLSDLAGAATPDSLPGLYQMLYEVILRKRTAHCSLRLHSTPGRITRMTAEPVRIAPGSLVWGVRAVFTDVTAERRRRESADHAEREARRQRQHVKTLGEVAEALREAVLPHFHDELASYGLQATVVYRPDAREAGVGGDWYKARRLPDGRLLVALGDARGHGLAAVTLMAKLRYALAGLAYTEQPVEQLTYWLNETACADGIESTATAIIARYHPERSLLSWTCAGHPNPVLVRDGRATPLPSPPGGPGLPLGVLPCTSYTAAGAALRTGDIVLMYSDGLTERRGSDPDQDTLRLLDAAALSFRTTAPGPGRDELHSYAEDLVARLDGPHRTDDATLLVLRRITPH